VGKPTLHGYFIQLKKYLQRWATQRFHVHTRKIANWFHLGTTFNLWVGSFPRPLMLLQLHFFFISSPTLFLFSSLSINFNSIFLNRSTWKAKHQVGHFILWWLWLWLWTINSNLVKLYSQSLGWGNILDHNSLLELELLRVVKSLDSSL